MKRISIVILAMFTVHTWAQTPPPAPAATPATDNQAPQGFVSKKTGMPISKAHIEDITNKNFPDMIESFDYPNADISDVIRAISELTGKNFIIDPQVRGKISIIAPSRITVAEAYKAFLSALAINGLAVVPGDGFYKIKPARLAQRDNIQTYSGAYYPTADQMITRIVKLKYINAKDVNTQLRILVSKDGELVPYVPTNSLIISDYGANMDRIMKILAQLDVQGYEERMEVIRVHNARVKDISDLIEKIINKGQPQSQFGIPRFRPAGFDQSSGGTSGAEVYSVVVPDVRTNSIVVVGNTAGINKIRDLVRRLDVPLGEGEQGGFHVYYLRHAEAEPIANMLNGIATESKKAQSQAAQPQAPQFGEVGPRGVQMGPPATAIFGGDVKVTADKNTNSLVIVASKQDYETVQQLISKLDIAKDQVYIKAIIMEMNSDKVNTWGFNLEKFDSGSNGIGRIGIRSTGISGITDPSNDQGAILGFGSGGLVDVTVPGGATFKVPSLTSFVNLVQTENAGNVLSTPQIMALNNEEAMIEVGEKVPVALNTTATTGGTTQQVDREPITTKLTITPFISPDTDAVTLKIDQKVAGIATTQAQSGATDLAKTSLSTTTREIKTKIVVDSGDTAVLGGLMQDEDDVQGSKVPVLGDIPILGWLFKGEKKTKKKDNLVVFITPKIVRNPADSASLMDEKLNERIDFIQRYMNGQDPFGHYIDALPRKKLSTGQTPPPEAPAVESF